MRTRFLLAILAVFTTCSHAKTWTVEKDGTGDFEIIQDAIDASADGDTVRVGPGRYDTFRQFTSTIDGFVGMTIAWVNKGITVLGAGRDHTIIGPESEVLDIDGLNPGCMYLDGGLPAVVRGFTFTNTKGFVAIRKATRLEDCRIDGWNKDRHAGYGVFIANASGVVLDDVELLGPGGILTTNSGVGDVLVVNCSFFNDVPRSRAQNSIASSARGLTVRNCDFEGSGVAISITFGGTATIEDCRLSEAIGGLSVNRGSALARNTTISRAEGNVWIDNGSVELYECELRGGTLWTIDAFGDIYARSCTILNAGGLSVRGPILGNLDVDLRENYWGTTDVSQVAEWIDDPSGTVQFEPILLGPVDADMQSMGAFKSRFRPRE